MYDASPHLQDLLIRDNSAECDGGGMYCSNSSPLLERVEFRENSTAEDGGALYCYSNSCVTLNECQFQGNAAGFGGAIYNRNNSDLNLHNCLFAGNEAERGGALYCRHSELQLNRVTLSENSANYAGGLTLRDNGVALISNSILWGNSPQQIGFYSDLEPNTLQVECSDIAGGEEGIETLDNGDVDWLEHNIDQDPLFCDPAGGDFRLQLDSPCRTDLCGLMGYTGETCDGESAGTAHPACPEGISLHQNYPNPFNPLTTIEFALPEAVEVELAVYNTIGQKVTVLVNGACTAGTHRVTFDAIAGAELSPGPLASGIYIYRLAAGEEVTVRKMLLVR